MSARKGTRTYDPKTGKWTKSTTKTTNKDSTKKAKAKSNSTKDSSNLTAESTDKNSATGSVEKKTNTIEYNTLTGELQYIATKLTIKLRAGNTVRLKGIGDYLSGKYYVQDVTRTLNSSGYTHSATLIKTNFGESLKKVETKKASSKKSTKKTSSSNGKKYHTVKKGETVYSIAKKYYKDSSKYTKIRNSDGTKLKSLKLKVGQKVLIS